MDSLGEQSVGTRTSTTDRVTVAETLDAGTSKGWAASAIQRLRAVDLGSDLVVVRGAVGNRGISWPRRVVAEATNIGAARWRHHLRLGFQGTRLARAGRRVQETEIVALQKRGLDWQVQAFLKEDAVKRTKLLGLACAIEREVDGAA